jgi:hypothetical protein
MGTNLRDAYIRTDSTDFAGPGMIGLSRTGLKRAMSRAKITKTRCFSTSYEIRRTHAKWNLISKIPEKVTGRNIEKPASDQR